MYKVPFPPWGGIESSCWGRKSSGEEVKGREEGKWKQRVKKGRGREDRRKGREWKEKGKGREGKWEVKEKRIGRGGERKREECRDKEWGRWGGKIGMRNNFFLP